MNEQEPTAAGPHNPWESVYAENGGNRPNREENEKERKKEVRKKIIYIM